MLGNRKFKGMVGSEEGTDINPPKGNEWEILTESAYAASPGTSGVESEAGEAETSNLMFMSGHFVFPPNQHENLPLEPKYEEKANVNDASRHVSKEPDIRVTEDEEHSTTDEGLVYGDFPAIPIFDEKGNIRPMNIAGNGNRRVFDEEQHSTSTEDRASDSGFENLSKLAEGCECNDDGNLPCGAWWKRRAFSIYRHAKEANAFWSVFVTAAVMGLVIVGHKWQHERWQILHLKWQAGVNRESMGWLIGPISRFRDVIASGVHLHGPKSLLERGSDSSQL